MLPGRLRRRLRVWRYGTGAYKRHYALSGPVWWTAAKARSAAVVHVAGELEALSRAAAQGTRGNVPDRPAIVGRPAVAARSDARAGVPAHPLSLRARARTVCARGRGGGGSPAGADRALRARVLRADTARAIRAPWQTGRENARLVGCDLAGGSYEIDQQLVFRPAPEVSRYGTPLRGLYAAGASMHPGGAVQGMSCRGAARRLLRDRRLRRV